MPYLMVQTNTSIDTEAAQAFISKASSTVSQLLGKSENYVMVSFQPPVSMTFAGTTAPAAFLELKSIGLPENATAEISNALCTLVSNELGIAQERVYIEFANDARHMWGWNGSTF